MAKGYLSVPIGFQRVDREPFLSDEKFDSMDAAEDYVNGTSPQGDIAYGGKMITVLMDGKYVPCVIQPDKSIEPAITLSRATDDALGGIKTGHPGSDMYKDTSGKMACPVDLDENGAAYTETGIYFIEDYLASRGIGKIIDDLREGKLPLYIVTSRSNYSNEKLVYPASYRVFTSEGCFIQYSVIRGDASVIAIRLLSFDYNGSYISQKTIQFKTDGSSTKYLGEDGQYHELPSGGGSSVTVDAALSATSTNPVQNKVVKAELDKKLDKAGGTMNGPIQYPTNSGESSSNYYIGAGSGRLATTGKLGMKILSYEDYKGSQHGIGSDLCYSTNDMSFAMTTGSESELGRFTFSRVNRNSSDYQLIAEIRTDGTAYVGGKRLLTETDKESIESGIDSKLQFVCKTYTFTPSNNTALTSLASQLVRDDADYLVLEVEDSSSSEYSIEWTFFRSFLVQRKGKVSYLFFHNNTDCTIKLVVPSNMRYLKIPKSGITIPPKCSMEVSVVYNGDWFIVTASEEMTL